MSIIAWKSRFRCAQHHCKQPNCQYIFARSQVTTPQNASPKKVVKAVASRVARTANTVNISATNVHNQALPFASFVPVSSMFRCSCVGSSAANSSYDGRKAAVTWFWIFTVSAGQHGWPNSVPRNSAVRRLLWR